jgi:hypothetical protein
MVFGLLGMVFNAVTFPGAIVNQIIQNVFEETYGAPTKRLAVPRGLDEDTIEENPELLQEIRELREGEEPREDETLEFVVDYDGIPGYTKLFWIVLGPFFVTSIVSLVLFAFTAGIEAAGIVERESSPLVWLVVFYPGFVVGARAFPNSEPTNELYARSQQTDSLLRLIGYPLVGISKLMSLLRFLWVDAIYALLLYLVIAVPLGLM